MALVRYAVGKSPAWLDRGLGVVVLSSRTGFLVIWENRTTRPARKGNVASASFAFSISMYTVGKAGIADKRLGVGWPKVLLA